MNARRPSRTAPLPFALSLLALVALLPPAPARAAEPSRLANRFVAIGSGPVAGTYFDLGVALASILNDRDPSSTHFAIPTEGSLENLALLARGDLAFAFCQSDLAAWAAAGDRMFAGAPMKNLRALLSLHPEAVQVVVRADSPLAALSDLKGCRVGMGAPRSGTRIHADAILSACGIGRADLHVDGAEFLPALEKLADRSLDALFFTAGVPTAGVAEFAARVPVRLLPIPADKAAGILSAQPYLTRATVPAGTYAGQTAEVATLATRALIVANGEVPPREVARLLDALFAARGRFAAAHPCGAALSREQATAGVPRELLHEASREYFDIK